MINNFQNRHWINRDSFHVFLLSHRMLQFLPLGPAEARVRRRKLAAFPCAAVLHVGHGVDGNELRIRADEDELAAA